MADLSDNDPKRDHDHEESEGTNKKRKMMTIPLSTDRYPRRDFKGGLRRIGKSTKKQRPPEGTN